MSDSSRNAYLDGPIAVIFAKTALPIIFVMSMNGLLTVADALFLGQFVGQGALAAVTLIFPLYMLIVALSNLVSAGMSSLLARLLGGGKAEEARTVYASAHWLAIAVSGALAALYVLFGADAIDLASGGDAELSGMASTFLGILVFTSPLMFVLSVNVDALRNEGHVAVMAAMSLLVSLSNVGFNYLLIGVLGMGVAGSAWGTVLAQALALVLVAVYRVRRRTILQPAAVLRHLTTAPWRAILALGAPQSLGFVGISLSASAILASLQIAHADAYAATVSAYGIFTRITTFTFLPLLGLAQAMQSITGNNRGAGLWRRADGSLGFAIAAAFVYCLGVELVLVGFAPSVGGLFVDDPQVTAKVAEITSAMLTLYLFTGPLMMVSMHFQAIGDAGRAAVLGLARPYLFFIPLVFALPLLCGAHTIWWAAPAADLLLLGLSAIVLWRNAGQQSLRWGLFGLPVREDARA